VARHRRATTGTPADMAGWNLLAADYFDVRGHSSTTAANRNKIDMHLYPAVSAPALAYRHERLCTSQDQCVILPVWYCTAGRKL
jgi:hypothetical protein